MLHFIQKLLGRTPRTTYRLIKVPHYFILQYRDNKGAWQDVPYLPKDPYCILHGTREDNCYAIGSIIHKTTLSILIRKFVREHLDIEPYLEQYNRDRTQIIRTYHAQHPFILQP
jgi:hypothetical protein